MLEQFFTAEIVGTGMTTLSSVLMYVNYGLRADLRAERKYSQGQEARNQELNSLYQDLAMSNTKTMTKIETLILAKWGA